MKTLLMDFETRSSVDIGACGSFRYMESPDFRPLLLAYAFDDEPVKLVDFTHGEDWPHDFVKGLEDPEITKLAWNCAFEREVLRRTIDYMPPEQWLDVMHIAAQCGLPMSLDAAGKALGLPEDQAKMKEGKQLIRWFCVPTKDSYFRDPAKYPDKWETFRRYCVQDVEAERTIYNLLKRWTPDATERRFWSLDQRINENGMNTDPQLVRNAMAFDARYKANLAEQAVALSGLDNPNSVAQVKAWLQEQEGIEVPSLNKKQIADVVAQLKGDASRQFMAIRAELSKSSTKKYEAIARSAGDDNHIRGCFQFYGASRTGRFAGRLVQLQNLPQNHMEDLADAREIVRAGDYDSLYAIWGDVSKVLSELIRTALIPEPGDRFIVADYSAIEARVIAWLAGEEWRLETFEQGGDIYCASASQMFGVPVVKHGVNGELRQKGKVAELALGYGGGPNAMLAFGADKLGMTDEEIANTVALWREKSPRICALWRTLEKAAIRCVVSGRGVLAGVKNVSFQMENGILWMTLPSGRRIAYYGARYEEGTGKFNKDRKVLSYMGKEQQTGKWARIETWGGKLTENCFGAGTPVLTADGWKPIERVHCQDLLWDGVGWVTCDGKVYKGLRTTVGLNGVRVTPEHRILTRKGWKRAETCNGLYGTPIQLPHAVVSTERWSGGRISIDPAERDEQVYDIRNAGPRHRFTIMTMSGPLIVHNCVQATARDCLRDSMLALTAAGYDIRAHVHDEVIITEPIGGRTVEEVCELMGRTPDWAEGLPLRADGYECDFYMKD